MKIFLIPLLILALIGGGYYFLKLQNTDNESSVLKNVIQNPFVDEITGWETYQNEEFGFKIQYPKDLKLEEYLNQRVNSEESKLGLMLSEGQGSFYLNVLTEDEYQKLEKNFDNLNIERNQVTSNNDLVGEVVIVKKESVYTSETRYIIYKNNEQIVVIKSFPLVSLESEKSKQDLTEYLQTFEKIYKSFEFTK